MQRSNRPEVTTVLGEQFAREHVRAGSVIAVRGELGAGKTHFIKGIARAFGIDERELTSPTFALVNEYEVHSQAIARLNHLDCYRFERPEELLELGVEDYLAPVDAATIIEWPERIEALLPRLRIEVHIDIISENERTITIFA